MRKPHTITKRHSTKLPYRIAFIDTETELTPLIDGSTLHTLKTGYCCVCNRVGQYSLSIKDEFTINTHNYFYERILRHVADKMRLVVVAHNISYDMPVLHVFTRLPEYGYKLSSLYREGQVGFASFKHGSREILFIDNGNFYQGKLAKWGELFGLPKLEIDLNNCTPDELHTYNVRDVEIMRLSWEKWLEFLTVNKCGEFRVTTASTAFNTYRHRFMDSKIYIHAEQEVIDQERKAYRGGRVECFYVGSRSDANYHYVDINSMYGYVMREYDYPIALRGYSDLSSESGDIHKLRKYCIIADVTLQCSEAFVPHTLYDKTIYPIGEFRTTLSTPELEYAISINALKQVHWRAWYARAKIFSDYVTYFYNKRLEYQASGNEQFAAIAKLFINSLYGKFGQMDTNQVILGECDPDIVFSSHGFNEATNQRFTINKLGGSIIQTIREGEAYDSFPAIAAHVTAYARMLLYSFIKRVPKHHVFYCDTDSLIVDDIGIKSLSDMLDSKALGKLKIEHSSHDLTIYAPKDYVMGDRVRSKGIRVSATKIADNTYQQTQWQSIKGMLRDGNADDYRTREITKHLKRTISSGLIGEDGWITPFELTIS